MSSLHGREGVTIDLGSWKVSEEFVGDYLGAVGDGSAAYFRHRLAPPAALAARALGSLLEKLELPPGAIHSLQEIETIRPIPFGEEIIGKSLVGPTKRRGGMEFVTVEASLKDREGAPMLGSKSTVLVVGQSSPTPLAGGRPSQGERGNRTPAATDMSDGDDAGTTIVPTVAKTITQGQLDAYAQVSGDRNPLHLDAVFAATTMFGGIIAHGMLTLAFISEMMAVMFDRAWLETGGLRVRFKGAAYVGDRVETRGRVAKEETGPAGQRLICSVAAYNPDRRQELASGTATVVLDTA